MRLYKTGDLVRWTNTGDEDVGIVVKADLPLVVVFWTSTPEDNAWYDSGSLYMELLNEGR